MSSSFVIGRRFRGPENSGNGGYTCGLVAGFVDGDAEVTLRRPPPLERPLEVTRDGERVLVHDGPDLVAEAVPTHLELEVPPPPTTAEAEAAAARYAGFATHVFPTCFVCGPKRAAGDGLRLFPGWVAGRDLVAAPVHTDDSLPAADGFLAREIAWSLLDCPGAWAMERDMEQTGVVLGRMAARVLRPMPVGAGGLAIGWPLGRDGRKLYSGTALFSPDGRLYGFARQTWIVRA
ncbi:MAG: hypothetical protein JW785_11000 [Acidimicrobiia bacterium]|nr:hypothetical protein [Acidimicrobiia bacterium]